MKRINRINLQLARKHQILLVIWLLSSMLHMQAQDKVNFDIGGDLVNRFIWRGMNLNTSASIQPYIELSGGAFTLGTWSSYTFSQETYQEVDVYLDYSYKNLSITLNDYFAPVDSLFTTNAYFNWDNKSTTHALEAIVTISDIGKLPLTFTGGVFIYGCDQNEIGENYYSTYLELNYDFELSKNTVSTFVGMTPFEGLYASNLAIVNTGITVSRDIKITEQLSLPIYGSFIINPYTENVYMVAGLTF